MDSGHRIYFMNNPRGGGIVVLGISDKPGQPDEIARCIERRRDVLARAAASPNSNPAHPASNHTHLDGQSVSRAVSSPSPEMRIARRARVLRAAARPLGFAAPLLAGGLAVATGSSSAEAAGIAADATPGVRIATAPNASEAALRAVGDSGNVLGPIGGLVTGVVEEGIRTVNDALGLVGLGGSSIQPGLISETASLIGSLLPAGSSATPPVTPRPPGPSR